MNGESFFDNFLEKINRRIPWNWRNYSSVVFALAFLFRLLSHCDKAFAQSLETACQVIGIRGKEKRKIKKDMIYEYARAFFPPEIYSKFRFHEKSSSERQTYLSYRELQQIALKTPGNFPRTKYERYRIFQAYFHRSVFLVHRSYTEKEASQYQQFISNKSSFIVKPLIGSKGYGVNKLETSEVPDLEALIRRVKMDCLLEEAIRGGGELAKFHPESVNTIRFVTAMNPYKSLFSLFALFRVGQGDSVVDNVGRGGLIAMVDMKTGIVCTDALCGTVWFERHPDTNVRFQGTQIPQWTELCSLARRIHLEHPEQPVFGFDFAWTDKGWDLVEINPVPAVSSFQILTGKGCRPLFQECGLL